MDASTCHRERPRLLDNLRADVALAGLFVIASSTDSIRFSPRREASFSVLSSAVIESITCLSMDIANTPKCPHTCSFRRYCIVRSMSPQFPLFPSKSIVGQMRDVLAQPVQKVNLIARRERAGVYFRPGIMRFPGGWLPSAWDLSTISTQAISVYEPASRVDTLEPVCTKEPPRWPPHAAARGLASGKDLPGADRKCGKR